MKMISIPVLGTELIVYDVHMREIGVEIIPASGDSVLLRELWLTATGYELLSKFEFGLRTSITEFSQIQNEFKRYGIKYQLRRVSDVTSLKQPRISNAMISNILSTMQKE
jgi:hypothetical protein